MDSTLHCNNSRCRCLCLDEAVVTTCSHIFCIPCAGRLGLTETRDGHRVCPACSTQLVNPDDAVIASLNPPEDYKTSILSGLSPTIIIECAGRGLAFWAYQMVQEMCEPPEHAGRRASYMYVLTRNL
jgi:E3 ubiquitin-protein ligase CCNP1IP1